MAIELNLGSLETDAPLWKRPAGTRLPLRNIRRLHGPGQSRTDRKSDDIANRKARRSTAITSRKFSPI